MHRRVVLCLLALGVLSLLAPSGAEAKKASKKQRAPAPVITSVTPMQVTVGQRLTIKGRHFRPGKRRNGVAFKVEGQKLVFAKSSLSTRRRLSVTVPAALDTLLKRSGRVRLRVLTSRFGKRYTSAKRSPRITPHPPAITPATTPVPVPTGDNGAPITADGDCDGDGVRNGADPDDDNDTLPDTLENQLGLQACKADSDGDSVSDAYEFRSAVDLNDDTYQDPDTALPYPGKRPYPNPLDPSDVTVDHDGDGLTLVEEFALFKRAGTATLGDPAQPLSYSAGKQYSLTIPATTYDKATNFVRWLQATGYVDVVLHDQKASWPAGSVGYHSYNLFDVNRDGTVDASEISPLDVDAPGRPGYGLLSDDERDEDADGLSNMVELHSTMTPGYWKSCYTAEPAYPVPYQGTSAIDADTDGDGIRDGADDSDFDDVPNLMELSRFAASGIDDTDGHQCTPDPNLDPAAPNHPTVFGFVHPFDPCKPDPESRTCRRYIQFGDTTGPNWWSLQ